MQENTVTLSHFRQLAPPHTHILQIEHTAQQEHCRCSRRQNPFQHTACALPHCPVATTIVPTAELCKQEAKMAALRLSVTGPLAVLHMSGVANVSAHALTYRSAAQERIRRLPSFAPSSISLSDFALRRLVYHFSHAGRVRVGWVEMTPDAHTPIPV